MSQHEDTKQYSIEEVESAPSETYAYIAGTRVPLKDVLTAHAGYLSSGLHTQSTHKFANPAPLGLVAFGLSALVLSIYNLHAQDIEEPNMIVGMAFFVGGIGQFISGMWEIVLENTFAATAMASFGGFWMSFGAILTPSFGIMAAYKGHVDQFYKASGFFMLGWTIFACGLTVCAMKSTVIFIVLFIALDMTFLTQTIFQFTQNDGVRIASAIFNLILAFMALLSAWAGLATDGNSYVTAKRLHVVLPGGQVHAAPPKH